MLPDCGEDDYGDYYPGDLSGLVGDTYKVINWTAYTTNKWAGLHDSDGKQL